MKIERSGVMFAKRKRVVDIRHALHECPDELQKIVAQKTKVLENIWFELYTGCFDCEVAQSICSR